MADSARNAAIACGPVMPNRAARSTPRFSETGKDNCVPMGPLWAMTRANNPSKTPVAIYVRGGATETIRRIGDGNYVIFYGYGDDWDVFSQRFLTDATYRKFADPFPYETTATTLPGWQLTLQSATGGSAPTDPVSGGDFPAFEGEEP